jgi:hypothetical protein
MILTVKRHVESGYQKINKDEQHEEELKLAET